MKNNRDNSGQPAGRKCLGMEVKGSIVEINAGKVFAVIIQQSERREWEYATVIGNNRTCFFTISSEKLSRE
jgi:hypothetical protein